MDLLELFPATAAGRTKSLTLRSKTSLSPKVRLGCNAAAGLRRRPGRPVFALKNDGSATGSWVLRGSPKMGDGARPTFQRRHGLIPLKISLTVFVPGTSQPRGHPQLGLGNRKAFTRDPSKLAARRTRSPDDVRIRPRRMPVNHQRARRSGAVEDRLPRARLGARSRPPRPRAYPRARINRALSRCQSRSAMAARLSCFLRPSPTPSSTFALPLSLKWICNGTNVAPWRVTCPSN